MEQPEVYGLIMGSEGALVAVDLLADMAGYWRPTSTSLNPILPSPAAVQGPPAPQGQLLDPKPPQTDPITAFFTVRYREHGLLILFYLFHPLTASSV